MSLSGKDLSLVTVRKSIDTVGRAGSFTVATAGHAAQTVEYSSDGATQAQNIKDAILALYGGADADVVVTLDGSSTASQRNYRITFQGSLAGQNIADISTNGTNRVNATVTPYNKVQGAEAVGETQKVLITTTATAGTLTLSLTHGGTTYTTQALSLEATQAAVQAALDSAFAGRRIPR